MIWLKIVKFILELIEEGMSKSQAILIARSKFGVSISDIKNHL